jgi:hypothetical protein
MNLHRLERHQHPKPPHQELRQKSVFDSGPVASARWATSTSMRTANLHPYGVRSAVAVLAERSRTAICMSCGCEPEEE